MKRIVSSASATERAQPDTDMKIDSAISPDLANVKRDITRLQEFGYDGARVAELTHDPFLPLTLAAEYSDNIDLMTSVAVAFARNPMSMAHLAHDLNAFSGGRFILGLGTQVQPHVVKRFGMPWHKAPRQMREFIHAMHAIFDCWYDGDTLDFEGEYYRHTLMPKTFQPTNIEFGRPKIYLSATGPLMTKVAAETADGLIMHPFSTERYIREVNLPAIIEGRKNADVSPDAFEIDYAPMIATGETEEEINKSIAQVKDRIAFYGSTPGYRMVLDLHGWGELQGELNRLMRQHRTAEMADLIDDEILHAFAIVGEPAKIAPEFKRRYGDLIDRSAFLAPGLSPELVRLIIAELKS
jgi:probable F420-dependent oxidoreductase